MGLCCSQSPEDRFSWDESQILSAQVLLQLALAARNPVIRDFDQDEPKIVSRSGNTTITNCRQVHGTMRKSHTIIILLVGIQVLKHPKII